MYTVQSLVKKLSLNPITVKRKIREGLLKATLKLVKHEKTACMSYCIEEEDFELYLKNNERESDLPELEEMDTRTPSSTD